MPHLELLRISSLFTPFLISDLSGLLLLRSELWENLLNYLLVKLELGLNTLSKFFIDRVLPRVELNQGDILLGQCDNLSAESPREVYPAPYDGKRADFQAFSD